MRSVVALAAFSLASMSAGAMSAGALAQSPPAPPSATAATAAKTADPKTGGPKGDAAKAEAPKAAAKADAPKPAAAQKCMRLPLSDIAVGRPETIAQAQLRLKEYSEAEAKRRGWSGQLVKSNETASCEDYLYLPLIGQEYKCLVTATFCVK
jgi:hypothetical protein